MLQDDAINIGLRATYPYPHTLRLLALVVYAHVESHACDLAALLMLMVIVCCDVCSCAPSRPQTFAVMDDFGLASNSWSPSTLERAAAQKSTTPVNLSTNGNPSKAAADAPALNNSSTTLEAASKKEEPADREACQLLPGQQFSLSICLDSSDGPLRR